MKQDDHCACEFDQPDYARPLQDHEAKGAARSAPQGGSMKPTIGRIVHYLSPSGNVSAAIVTGVLQPSETNEVVLTVFPAYDTPYSTTPVPEGKGVHSWSWLERAQ